MASPSLSLMEKPTSFFLLSTASTQRKVFNRAVIARYALCRGASGSLAEGDVGRESRGGSKEKGEESAVKSGGQAAAKSGQEGDVNQFAHDPLAPSPRRQLVLKRDALEVFPEMLDAILGLLALKPRHQPANRVRCRVPCSVLGMIVDDGPGFELVGHLSRPRP